MDPSSMVARLVVLETFAQDVGTGIEVTKESTSERIQDFAKPIPLPMIERMAGSILGPMRRTVRAFSPNNSLIGEWSFNAQQYEQNQRIQLGKANGEKTPKPALSPAEKEAKKLALKLSKAEKEREQLAKAPKALLPFEKRSQIAIGFNKTYETLDRGLCAVPLIHSESKVTVWLTDREGKQTVIPILEGLYTSAVSRGKAANKENPDVDPLKYVKRLIADLLLGSGASHTARNESGKLQRFDTQSYVKATLNCSKEGHEPVELNRVEALKVQKKLAREVYKRQVRAVSKKGPTPFGSNCYKWQGSCKQSRAEFSRG